MPERWSEVNRDPGRQRVASAVVIRAPALLAAAAFATSAARADQKPGPHPLSVAVEALYAGPSGAAAVRAGGGGALRLGWSLTDQISLVGDAAFFALRGGGTAQSLAFGLQALLDATPIAPFVEVTVLRLIPFEQLGYSLATRTGLGADWRFSPHAALGAVVRYITPLDDAGGLDHSTLQAGLRLVLTL